MLNLYVTVSNNEKKLKPFNTQMLGEPLICNNEKKLKQWNPNYRCESLCGNNEKKLKQSLQTGKKL